MRQLIHSGEGAFDLKEGNTRGEWGYPLPLCQDVTHEPVNNAGL